MFITPVVTGNVLGGRAHAMDMIYENSGLDAVPIRHVVPALHDEGTARAILHYPAKRFLQAHTPVFGTGLPVVAMRWACDKNHGTRVLHEFGAEQAQMNVSEKEVYRS